MRTKIYEERTKEEIEIERQRLDVELTYQTLLNAHLANQLKEKEEKKMKNKLSKVFTKREKKEDVLSMITEAWLNDESVELTDEQVERLSDQIYMRERKYMFIGGAAVLAGWFIGEVIIKMRD